jgi:hypothetical protein
MKLSKLYETLDPIRRSMEHSLQAQEDPMARLRLAINQLRSGNPDEALATIAPIMGDTDPGIQQLIYRAYLDGGITQQEREQLAQIISRRPEDARPRTKERLIDIIKAS